MNTSLCRISVPVTDGVMSGMLILPALRPDRGREGGFGAGIALVSDPDTVLEQTIK